MKKRFCQRAGAYGGIPYTHRVAVNSFLRHTPKEVSRAQGRKTTPHPG